MRSSTSMLKMLPIILLCGTVMLFLWEHVGRQSQVSIRPSIIMDFLVGHLQNFFYWCGSVWARISSYITYIDLTELKITAYDLLMAFWKLIESPVYAIKGFCEMALSYKYQSWQIYLGSVILFCVTASVVLFLLKRKYPNHPFWNYLLSALNK